MLTFEFLNAPAGFAMSETLLGNGLYSPLWMVLAAGVLNTLKVALPAWLLSMLLGTALGFAQLSQDAWVSRTARMIVQLVRNVPLLLLLLAVYFAWIKLFPPADQAWQINGMVYVSKSGLVVPELNDWTWQLPAQGRFAVEGGLALSTEWLALTLALGLYTAVYVAEVVRAGVQSVPTGQVHAARALGLNTMQVRRWVVWPLALRLAVPPLANQSINLLKNASLGVAVGYPELVSVGNTAMNQSGRVVECVLVVMLIYALLSALTAGLFARINRRVNAGASA